MLSARCVTPEPTPKLALRSRIFCVLRALGLASPTASFSVASYRAAQVAYPTAVMELASLVSVEDGTVDILEFWPPASEGDAEVSSCLCYVVTPRFSVVRAGRLLVLRPACSGNAGSWRGRRRAFDPCPSKSRCLVREWGMGQPRRPLRCPRCDRGFAGCNGRVLSASRCSVCRGHSLRRLATFSVPRRHRSACQKSGWPLP